MNKLRYIKCGCCGNIFVADEDIFINLCYSCLQKDISMNKIKNKNSILNIDCINILNQIIEDLSDRPGLLFPWNLYLDGLKTVRDYLSSLSSLE